MRIAELDPTLPAAQKLIAFSADRPDA